MPPEPPTQVIGIKSIKAWGEHAKPCKRLHKGICEIASKASNYPLIITRAWKYRREHLPYQPKAVEGQHDFNDCNLGLEQETHLR